MRRPLSQPRRSKVSSAELAGSLSPIDLRLCRMWTTASSCSKSQPLLPDSNPSTTLKAWCSCSRTCNTAKLRLSCKNNASTRPHAQHRERVTCCAESEETEGGGCVCTAVAADRDARTDRSRGRQLAVLSPSHAVIRSRHCRDNCTTRPAAGVLTSASCAASCSRRAGSWMSQPGNSAANGASASSSVPIAIC